MREEKSRCCNSYSLPGPDLHGIQDPQKEWFAPGPGMLLCRSVRLFKTEGGLEVPSSARDPKPMVRVLAIGPDVIHFAPGDLILLKGTTGSEITLNGELLAITKEDNVAGTYRNVDMTGRKEGLSPEDAAKILDDIRAANKLLQTSEGAANVAPRLLRGGKRR